MNISENGKNLIKKYEGCRLVAYRCPSGILTIGWGHTNGVYEGQTITQYEADKMFDEDVKKYEYPVQQYTWLNQNQFDALTSFCYNCGQGALEDVMTSGDITGTMKLYIHGGGQVLQGLVKRRNEEIELYNTPINNDEYIIKEYEEHGTFFPNIQIFFRDEPKIIESNTIRGSYLVGESVIYDTVVITNKYVYISWISVTSGWRRYMPVREVINGELQELWGYIK